MCIEVYQLNKQICKSDFFIWVTFYFSVHFPYKSFKIIIRNDWNVYCVVHLGALNYLLIFFFNSLKNNKNSISLPCADYFLWFICLW